MLPRIMISGASTPLLDVDQQRESQGVTPSPLPDRKYVSFPPDSQTSRPIPTNPESLLFTDQKRTKRPATPFVWFGEGVEDDDDDDDVATSVMPSLAGSPIEEATIIKM
jgi:hypothetical protein